MIPIWTKFNRPSSQYRCSTEVWSNTNIKQANEKNKTKLGSGPILEISIFIRFFLANGQALVHLLILVCSFQWCVLFLCLAKFYRSCPIRDKGLLAITVVLQKVHISYYYRCVTVISLALWSIFLILCCKDVHTMYHLLKEKKEKKFLEMHNKQIIVP